jgi:hypothetical protein
MSAGRPTFRQIPAPLDVDDKALDRLNDKLDVPTLVRPTPPPPAPAMPSSGQGKAQDAPNAESLPSPARKPRNPQLVEKSAPTPPGPVERLTVEIPGYLTDAMRLEAAQARCSLRHIILRGLAAIGYELDAVDLVPDARRRPPKRRKR